MKGALALAIAALTLAGCGSSIPTAPAQTWLAVHGPRDWTAPEAMSLEIGDRAWTMTPAGGSGVVTPDIADQAHVRLIGMETCREYAAFDISAGSSWIIRFEEDGAVTVEDAAGGPREMGPGLVEGPPSVCSTPES